MGAGWLTGGLVNWPAFTLYGFALAGLVLLLYGALAAVHLWLGPLGVAGAVLFGVAAVLWWLAKELG